MKKWWLIVLLSMAICGQASATSDECDAYIRYVEKVRNAFLNKDYNWLGGQIEVAVVVSVKGEQKTVDSSEFVAVANDAFTPEFIERIRNDTEMITTCDGVTIGNGAIWMQRYPGYGRRATEFKITDINNRPPIKEKSDCDPIPFYKYEMAVDRAIILDSMLDVILRRDSTSKPLDIEKVTRTYEEGELGDMMYGCAQCVAIKKDTVLARKMMRSILTHENSTDEMYSLAMGGLYACDPDFTLALISGYSPEKRAFLTKSLTWGWENIKCWYYILWGSPRRADSLTRRLSQFSGMTLHKGTCLTQMSLYDSSAIVEMMYGHWIITSFKELEKIDMYTQYALKHIGKEVVIAPDTFFFEDARIQFPDTGNQAIMAILGEKYCQSPHYQVHKVSTLGDYFITRYRTQASALGISGNCIYAVDISCPGWDPEQGYGQEFYVISSKKMIYYLGGVAFVLTKK